MVSANLDLVRSVLADWERGDYGSAEWAHSEIEFVFADGPAPGTWTGLAGMADGMREFLTSWAQWHVETDEYRELDPESVLVLVHRRGRGKTSGLNVGEPRATGAALFHLHNGKAFQLIIYWDREPAFHDLGLTPEAG
jgi:ketosteroid isomerase-like protein